MKIALSSSVAVLALLIAVTSARADPVLLPPVSGSATSLGDGLYKYQYTLTNTGQATYVQALFIQSLDGGHISESQWQYYRDKYISSSPTAPFLNPTASSHFAYSQDLFWGTTDAPDGGLTLGQKAILSVVAPFPPGTVPYGIQLESPAPDGGESLPAYVPWGTVIGPVDNPSDSVNTPEPGTGVLIGIGMLCLAVSRRGLPTYRLLLSASRCAWG